MSPPAPPSTAKNQHVFPLYYDIALVAVFLCAGIVLRAGYLNEIRQQPDFDIPLLDAAFYNYWARGIAFDQWTVPPEANDPEIRTIPYTRPPGYPYFLAGIYALTGGSYLAVRLVQMTIGLASAVLMYFLARRLFGRVAALAACLFMSTYWVFIFYEGELNTPPLVVFLQLLLMATLGRWHERKKWAYALGAGCILGAMALFRPETLMVAPLIAGFIWWAGWKRLPVRRLALDSFLAALGCALFIAPVTLRNYRVSGEFVLITTAGGLNIYACNNPASDGTWPTINSKETLGLNQTGLNNNNMPYYLRALRKKLHDDTLTYGGLSRHFSRLAWDYIRQNPGRTMRLLAKKALLFWGPVEITNNKEIHFAKQYSTTLRFLPGFPFAAALFVTGLVVFFRRKPRAPVCNNRKLALLILSYAAIYFLTIIWFMVAARFRVPVIPFLLLFGGLGLGTFLQSMFNNDFRHALRLLAVFVCALAFFSVNVAGYRPKPAQWHVQRGYAFAEKRLYTEAEQEYRLAMACNDPQWPGLEPLGKLLLEQGRLHEALECYQQALTTSVVINTSMYIGVGNVLKQMGRIDDAIAMFEKAIAFEEDNASAHLNLGLALVEKREFDRAKAEFNRVVNDLAARRHALHNLAWIEDLQGNTGEAKAGYEQTLNEFPEYPESNNNLGYLLKNEGRVEEARKYFEAALKANPQYQLAHENMAVLLRDQGDREGALKHLREALRLAPNNKAILQEIETLTRTAP